MSQHLHQTLLERQREMEESIFRHPPETWEEFQRRRGQWIELDFVLAEIEGRNQEQKHEDQD